MRGKVVSSPANPLLKDVRRSVAQGTLTADGLWVAGELSPARRSVTKRPRSTDGSRLDKSSGRCRTPCRQAEKRSPDRSRRAAVPADRRNRVHAGSDLAGASAGLEATGCVSTLPAGGCIGRIARPRQRRSNRAFGRGLWGDGRYFPGWYGKPVQRQDLARFGGIAVSSAFCVRHRQ